MQIPSRDCGKNAKFDKILQILTKHHRKNAIFKRISKELQIYTKNCEKNCKIQKKSWIFFIIYSESYDKSQILLRSQIFSVNNNKKYEFPQRIANIYISSKVHGKNVIFGKGFLKEMQILTKDCKKCKFWQRDHRKWDCCQKIAENKKTNLDTCLRKKCKFWQKIQKKINIWQRIMAKM